MARRYHSYAVALAGTSLLWTRDLRQGSIELLFFLFPFSALVVVVARSPWRKWHPRALATTLVALAALFSAVALFHFFFSWNDFFVPLLYLSAKPELQTLPIAIQQYNALYVTQPTLIQAAALMTMAVPVVVFFLAQRSFMRSIVVTGVDK